MSAKIVGARSDDRNRIVAVVGVCAIHLLLGYALIFGLQVQAPDILAERLVVFAMTPSPAQPPRKPIRANRHHRAQMATPPNLKAKAAEVIAPIVPAAAKSPVVTTPTPGIGATSTAGAASMAGPGSGAGGRGNGSGNGDTGNGDGGGTDLEWLSGEIRDSDYPRDALKAGIGGTVHMRFTVGVTGRVTDCVVTRSSGNPSLDAATCTLIRKRFRYRPSSDASGRAVADEVTGEHVWSTDRHVVTTEDE